MIKMLRCSRYLWFFTYFMLGFPVVYLVFAAFTFELKSKGTISVALSPLFYLASVFWVMTGVGIRQLKQWSWYTLGAAQFFITYLNALNLLNYSHSQFKGYAFILTLVIQFFIYFIIERELKVPFLFPKIRWWESGIAGMHNLTVDVFHSRSASGMSHAQMLDVSMRGCFLKSPIDFELNEKIKLHVRAYGHEVDIPGIIVWNAKSTVTHPKGIGIKFQTLNRTRKRKVKIISKRFEREKDQENVVVKVSA